MNLAHEIFPGKKSQFVGKYINTLRLKTKNNISTFEASNKTLKNVHKFIYGFL